MTQESSPSLRVLRERYRLDARIGEGGMGVVYRGVDLALERDVAVKLMRAQTDADPGNAARFLREVKSAAKIRHEHVIEVFDVGEDLGGDLFYVMELLAGESLRARLQREGRLAPAAAIHVAVQVCEALSAAHEGGVIHRDLKPANVMLLRRGPDDAYVKLIDFGISKTAEPTTIPTRTGEIIGTIGYMAPEQIRGDRVDARTDLYALGVMLYRALTGVDVFEDRGLPAAVHDHLETAPRSLRERAPDAEIPAALDDAVLRCLAKRPEDRFDSAASAAEALRRSGEIDPGAPLEIFLGSEQVPFDAPATLELPSEVDTGSAMQFELAEVAPAQTPAAPLGPRVCVQCGTENQRYAQFCSTCSDPLDSPEQVEQRALAPLAPLVPLGSMPLAERVSASFSMQTGSAKAKLAVHAAVVLTFLTGWAVGFGLFSISALALSLLVWISVFLGPIRHRRR
jgi:serine/threonine-protein kinase